MDDLAGKTIWVAGHRGLVGSALVRRLASEDCTILTAPRDRLDLERRDQVDAFLEAHRPDAVILAAARVGGIHANATQPADFLRGNAMIALNVIDAAHKAGVDRLLYLGSSCIYPRDTPQPIREEALMTGLLEPTNQGYAVAKILGLHYVQSMRAQHGRDYIAAMPTNLYGPGDCFDLVNGHVLPALLRRTHEAHIADDPHLTVWGTGRPRREFLHVDDCAEALVLLLKRYSDAMPVNVGYGSDIAIADLAALICEVTGYRGEIAFDLTRADGTPRKLLDSSRMRALGWHPRIDLEAGIAATYDWYLSHQSARAA